jgi:putative flippase GtrA
VPLARLLPERTYRLARELTTYSVVGVANTAIDFALFNGLISLGWLYANTLSTVVSSTTSYFMNRHWVYHDRPRTAVHRGYTLFFVVNLIGLAIQGVVLLGLTRYGVGPHRAETRLQLNLFKCVGVVVALFFRFWAYRTFVFRPHPTARHAAVSETEVVALTADRQVPADEDLDPLTAPEVEARRAGYDRRPAPGRDLNPLDINPFSGKAGRA